MISVDNISVQIGSTSILKDVSMQMPEGKLSIVVGKNGAGKSTLLKAVCNNIKTSQGHIYFDSTALNALDAKEIARKRAVVLQNTRLSFSFTAFEIILMGRTPHTNGFESKKDYEVAEQCMEKLQVEHLRERKYPTLSGGEKQRVQLARALAQIWERIDKDDPCYLLLDEPTSSLDIAHQHQLLSLLKELAQNGVTVFVVIHDLNLAAQYGDLIHVMKDGKCVASGSTEDIFQPDIIGDAFECPVRILQNPHFNCPLIVSGAQTSQLTHSNNNMVASGPSKVSS